MISNKIILKYHHAFNWCESDNIIAKGSFFDENESYYNSNSNDFSSKLLSYLQNVNSTEEFTKKINNLTGIFSIIFITKDNIFITVDRVRYFPLFYTQIDDTLYISDSVESISEKFDKTIINKIAEREFSASGFTLGNKTLIDNIFQVNTSEIISYDNNLKLSKFSYDNYCIKNNISENESDKNLLSYDELANKTESILEKIFKRMISTLNGRKVAIPLSGGYDSRLIAAMLKYFGYNNVLCFTYGRKDSEEIELSRKTAEKLGFRWIFIEYTNELVENFIDNQLFQDYYKFASNHTSMFYLQEYFAMKYLIDENLVNDETIFIPGHSGDFLAGSQLIRNEINNNNNYTTKSILKKLISKKFKLYSNNSQKNETIRDIENRIDDKILENYIPYSIFEDFDWTEKIAKVIFNSSKVFNYFGCEVRFPFADSDLITFFKHIPYKYRLNKMLYDKVITDKYFKKYNLNFENELTGSNYTHIKQNFKDKIKKIVPKSILSNISQKKNDKFFHKEITDLLIKDMDKKGKKMKPIVGGYNFALINWYLSEIEIN